MIRLVSSKDYSDWFSSEVYKQLWKEFENLVKKKMIEKGYRQIRINFLPSNLMIAAKDLELYCNSLGLIINPEEGLSLLETKGAEYASSYYVEQYEKKYPIKYGCYVKDEVLSYYAEKPGETRVVLDRGIKEIGRDVFQDCLYLKEVVIPEGVTKIDNGAFFFCESVESVSLPSSLIEIENFAFANCRRLNHLDIPSSVQTVGKDSFLGIKSINYRNIEIDEEALSCDYTEQIFKMINSLNFRYNIPGRIKSDLILKMLFNDPNNSTLVSKVRNSIARILRYAIEDNDVDLIQKIFEHGKVVTKSNIDSLINIAIESRSYEIYVLLLNHKNNKTGYKKRNWEL